MKEIFNLFLNSTQSLQGSTAPTGNLSYDFGSVVGNMPLMDKYYTKSYCYIKVKTFCIHNNSPSVSTQANIIQITANLSQPCGATTTNSGAGLITSNIIGLIPTNAGNQLYNPSFGYYQNDWVKVSNPFKGIVNIIMKDEHGVNLAFAAANKYQLLLNIYFDESC